MADNGTLSTPQRRALAALLTERDVRGAAELAKVSERSLWRWLADASFRAELAKQESDLLDAAARRLLALQDKALEVFSRVMDDAGATDANQLRAAQAVIDALLKLRELVTLEKRLAVLEEKLEVNQ